MIEKEKCIECGKKLAVSRNEKALYTKMTQIMNLWGKISYRDTVDEVILVCLQKEVDVQCLIDVLNASEEEQKKSLQYFFAGYNSK